jgi:uncharacterized pyridoxamine 5'-phosphate oxidase family protein
MAQLIAEFKIIMPTFQIKEFVEFSSTTPSFAWIRLSSEVKFSDDKKVKEKILATNGLVKSIYQFGKI